MELTDIFTAAEELRKLAASVREDAKKIKETCSEIDSSWSQSAFTRHAKFYFGDYEEPPVRNQFNIEWGLINGIPAGWEEKSNDEVCKEIEKRSGVSTSRLKEVVTKLESEFKILRRNASLSLIEGGVRDVSGVESFKFTGATKHFNTLNKVPRMTRDSSAVASGVYIAPHIYFEAIAMSALGIEEQLDEFIYKVRKLSGTTPSKGGEDLWNLIHPAIRAVSEKQFKDGHFLDAIRSAFIEFNDRVKQKYKKDTGVEEDGFNLMKLAFGDFSTANAGLNKTVKYSLADLSTDSGRNFQKGFSLISAGTVLGLRNPRAHANISEEKDEAIHLIFLASWLMKIFSP